MKTIIIVKNICISILLVLLFAAIYSIFQQVMEIELDIRIAGIIGMSIGLYLVAKTLYEVYTLED